MVHVGSLRVSMHATPGCTSLHPFGYGLSRFIVLERLADLPIVIQKVIICENANDSEHHSLCITKRCMHVSNNELDVTGDQCLREMQ